MKIRKLLHIKMLSLNNKIETIGMKIKYICANTFWHENITNYFQIKYRKSGNKKF